MTAPPQITIGIDARAAAEVPAGRGRVVRELLRALASRPRDQNRYLLYTREQWHGAQLDERFSWRRIAARDPWWHVRAARAANRECDVFLSSNSYLTVCFLRIPAVPIIHDLIAFEPQMRPNLRSTVIERLTLGPAVRRSAAFVAVSQATADALATRYPAAAPRRVVAHLGVSPMHAGGVDDGEAATLPQAGFVLAVGTLEPRKNLMRLVAAYSSLDEELQRHHPLVVVGALGWEAGETLDALRSLGERCTMLGFVSDEALAELYRRCAVFCYPSLGEGFGLPVLEAMAAGAAVITSRVSSLPEVGGDAVEYVEPNETSSIASALNELLSDASRRDDLGRRAQERAGKFSWERFAEITLDTLDGVAIDHSPAAADGGRDQLDATLSRPS
jgi:glycosyltransferase involved in cell wall biosynthesis